MHAPVPCFYISQDKLEVMEPGDGMSVGAAISLSVEAGQLLLQGKIILNLPLKILANEKGRTHQSTNIWKTISFPKKQAIIDDS